MEQWLLKFPLYVMSGMNSVQALEVQGQRKNRLNRMCMFPSKESNINKNVNLLGCGWLDGLGAK